MFRVMTIDLWVPGVGRVIISGVGHYKELTGRGFSPSDLRVCCPEAGEKARVVPRKTPHITNMPVQRGK